MNLIDNRLNREKHFKIVGEFCCGADDPLNNFLTDDSFTYDEERYGNTYLVCDDETKAVLAYYTLKASGIQTLIDGEYNSLPVIELSRIAVHYEFQHMGLGKQISESFNEECDLYVVSLDAENPIEIK